VSLSGGRRYTAAWGQTARNVVNDAVAEIRGSASTIIVVRKAVLVAETTSQLVRLQQSVLTVAGGTPVIADAVPWDTQFAAGTAVVRHFNSTSAAPAGLILNIWAPQVNGSYIDNEFTTNMGSGFVLRGIAEFLRWQVLRAVADEMSGYFIWEEF